MRIHIHIINYKSNIFFIANSILSINTYGYRGRSIFFFFFDDQCIHVRMNLDHANVGHIECVCMCVSPFQRYSDILQSVQKFLRRERIEKKKIRN